MKLSLLPILTAALSLPALAHADPADPASPTPVADRGTSETSSASNLPTNDGFLLHMSAGPATMGAGFQPENSPELGVGGGGSLLNIMVGAHIVPNLALHADFLAAGVDDARARVDDDTAEFDSAGVGVAAAGVGVTYFVMPYNLSLTSSILYAKLGAGIRDGYSYETDHAMLGKFSIAKEWPVAESWALGFGGTAFAGYGTGTDSSSEASEAGFGGLSADFFATYD